MEENEIGTFIYKTKISKEGLKKLPSELNQSTLGILIQLFLGTITVFDLDNKKVYSANENYTLLPFEKHGKVSYKLFSDFFDINILDKDEANLCNRFIKYDRKNTFVYEHILDEVTQYLVIREKSPIEGFVHLYRVLEFLSYSFPLIYAIKSKDYRGSFEALKDFVSGNPGELKFFKVFLEELFNDDYSMDFTFERNINVAKIDKLANELGQVINMSVFEFEGETFRCKFRDVGDIIIRLRNRYFHMLIGKGYNNFYDTSYNKNELFKGLNPIFMNWIAVIFMKEIQLVFSSML